MRIEWEALGEGLAGDHDPTDPEDEELLRFYVRRWDADAGEWEDVEDASYCTNFPATASVAERQSALEYLMQQFRGPVEAGESVKNLGERMSWISPEWLKAQQVPIRPRPPVLPPTPDQRVAQALAQHHAEEFRACVARYNARHPEHQATVRKLARRFRLQVLVQDIENVQGAAGAQVPGIEAIRAAAENARFLLRSSDFGASADCYLQVCRWQWEAMTAGQPGARLDDLRYYMAFYASVQAGHLATNQRDHKAARPYYLAFFSLVQEGDVLWDRLRPLVTPMLCYYYSNAARETGASFAASDLPTETVVRMVTHANADVSAQWQKVTRELAADNPGVLRRIAEQLERSESAEDVDVAAQIEQILAKSDPGQNGR